MSDVQICNLALSHLGTPGISSLQEQSKTARQCLIHYELARDYVLRDFPWNFAEKRQALALLSNITPIGYDLAYAYPTDCLKALRIYNTVEGADEIDFRITSADDGKSKMILTNEEDARLIYTMQITDTNLFDSLFVKALSHYLAAELAQPLTKKTSLQSAMIQLYTGIISAATASNASEGRDMSESDNPFIASRG
jgi:hypothetical protein